MAKYYLGKLVGRDYLPLELENVGTGILDVVAFTTSFTCEEELRERLLEEGQIEYYDSEIGYIMEEGPKGNKTYKLIPMGSHIATILSKHNFDKRNLRAYLQRHKYDTEFYSSLMNYYLKKLKITDNMDRLINYMVNIPSMILELCRKKGYFSKESRSILEELEKVTIERNYQRMQELLSHFAYTIKGNKHNLINAYYFFRPSLKNVYTGTVDRINTAYQVMIRANNQGIYAYETNPDEDHDLAKYIDEIYESLIYNYDHSKKAYKKDSKGNRKVNDRNLYELAMFIDLHEQYQLMKDRQLVSQPDLDTEHEDFLEEEDFKALHTTSEREGFVLRKTDKDLYQNKY